MSKKSKAKKEALMKQREEGFDLNSIPHAKLKEYSALHDPNMRHYFENPNVQRLLYQSGQIDRHGRVINLEKNKSKLQILDREFRDAERLEQRRLKEEMEMRYRVQRKRFQQLEDAQKQDLMTKLKADRELSKEILSTIRSTATASPSRALSRSSNNKSGDRSMFFVTEG
mmetsp:Transcript_4992/g.7626  ORF Transcript_4992/g.7626 Transcript_4992/m.7626 type:complete len:170 (+) Transcript_4992:184-693(+)|eukprot:CAMPEP_0185030260 /NCGR_PEP_ID=MMETSP1103-20130426/17117_1 /TAXON_ID=36769 /ORGANISM="Paraphysomonas bandaiensis, Strain Caron Lab Isolate" /LENGTH=169 /DNA_ID=CAMNT_0027565319 /DNA_START=140 /DNA_END=649 /DNA_ORIENTATION=+